jgi:predicted ester cyclase
MADTETAAKSQGKRKKGAKTVVREYFDALADQDLDRAVACWRPGGRDTLHGTADLVAPDGIRQFFSEVFAAFPDWRFEVLELTGSGDTAAARWRVRATFTGPGRFQGVAPTGRSVTLEGCDMFRVEDELIVQNDAYSNGMQLAEQIGLLPPTHSSAGRAMTAAFNARTAAVGAVRRLRER